MATSDEIFSAVQANDTERVVALLTESETLAEARNADGLSIILYARYLFRMEALAALLKAERPLDIFEAAALGLSDRIADLLAADRALARASSLDGFTALHLTAFFGHAEAARRLVAAGADVRLVSANVMAVMPLNSAVAGGNHAVAALLLAHGADPDGRQRGGWTPLHSAAQNGDRELVDLLLSGGADPALTNDLGQTPAALAAENGHGAIAERLRL